MKTYNKVKQYNNICNCNLFSNYLNLIYNVKIHSGSAKHSSFLIKLIKRQKISGFPFNDKHVTTLDE